MKSEAQKLWHRLWRKSPAGIAYNRRAAALYRARYPERDKARKAAYHQKNREKVLAQVAKWQSENREAVRAHQANNKAMRKRAIGKHTAAEIRALYQRQGGLCAICEMALGEIYHRDHITALARGGNNYIANIQLLCPRCNLRKGAR